MDADGVREHLLRIGKTARERLLSAEAAKTQALLDLCCATSGWQMAGGTIIALEEMQAPPIAPDLNLAEAALQSEGACYLVKKQWWLALARVRSKITVGPRKHIVPATLPILGYVTEFETGNLAVGRIDPTSQPTPRDLCRTPGWAFDQGSVAELNPFDIAPQGIRLAQCLPWFFNGPEKSGC